MAGRVETQAAQDKMTKGIFHFVGQQFLILILILILISWFFMVEATIHWIKIGLTHCLIKAAARFCR